jgi:hypothetical protein
MANVHFTIGPVSTGLCSFLPARETETDGDDELS